jgi:hypothetical protein
LRELYGRVPVDGIARLLGRPAGSVVEEAAGRAPDAVPHRYDRRFFAAVTDETAYWAGFVAGAGSVHRARQAVQVYLPTRDRGHLVAFAEALGYDGPVVDHAVGGGTLSRLTLGQAQEMIDDLRRNFRVTGRKSKTLPPPDLPVPLARPFLRGLIDGDGAVYRDAGGRFCLGLRGTEAVLKWATRLADRVCPAERMANVTWYGGYASFRLSGARAEALYLWLYRDAAAALDRKRAFVEELLAREDYPSSHSMDSQWMAVDRDGHVAVFSTGEAGAMPQDAEGVADLLERCRGLLPRTEPVYDLEGYRLPGRDPRPAHLPGGGASDTVQYVLLFLRSADPVREALAAGQGAVHPAAQGVAVAFREMPAELYRRLHEAGECLGCDFHYISDDPEAGPTNPAALGLFRYAHLCENWISGPYGRRGRPDRPLHVDQLPPALRDLLLGRFHLASLCFAEAPHVQPVEHFPCISWETRYLGSDGKTVRPMPGHEGEGVEDEVLLEDLFGEEGPEGDGPGG